MPSIDVHPAIGIPGGAGPRTALRPGGRGVPCGPADAVRGDPLAGARARRVAGPPWARVRGADARGRVDPPLGAARAGRPRVVEAGGVAVARRARGNAADRRDPDLAAAVAADHRALS